MTPAEIAARAYVGTRQDGTHPWDDTDGDDVRRHMIRRMEIALATLLPDREAFHEARHRTLVGMLEREHARYLSEFNARVALGSQLRALVRLLFPDEMTPHAKARFDSILDDDVSFT